MISRDRVLLDAHQRSKYDMICMNPSSIPGWYSSSAVTDIYLVVTLLFSSFSLPITCHHYDRPHLPTMKISIPNLPPPSATNPAFINPLANITLPRAVAKTQDFLEKGKGKTLVMTGAGVSVDSGIRAYRGSEGHCK